MAEANSRPRLVDDVHDWDDDSTRSEIWGARLAHALGLLIRRPGLGIAVLFILFVIVAAAFPHLFTSHDPFATSPANKIRPPSLDHFFGTDHVGRDLFTRVLYGSKLTIQATVLAIAIAAVVGLLLGVLSGFTGGKVDAVLMRVVDVTLAIPALLLALAIVTAIGFGTLQVAIAVGVGSIPAFARTTRSEVLKVKALPFVEAARLCGTGWWMIVWKHILPNSSGPVVVLAILEFGGAVLAVAALSFLGFGAQPPAAEWGTLISEGRGYLMTAPWVSLLPGLFVALVVFSLNHIAKTLEELQR
ncbi:MAG: ABC transporter permease [Pseudochelatococcus sp.]|jgi:peptide/nickel transport system permease protein|uniref:ABC transporter permease n=1 Tax=Pseudochelatococcus sp. TaxID=2020869 RepID=UPI003D8E9ABB